MSDQYCHRCGERAVVAADAEPDVGIMVPLYHCDEHGEFWFDSSDKPQFVEDEHVG